MIILHLIRVYKYNKHVAARSWKGQAVLVYQAGVKRMCWQKRGRQGDEVRRCDNAGGGNEVVHYVKKDTYN